MAELQEFYSTREEVEKALAAYNEGRPRNEWMFYVRVYDSWNRKAMYIPCTEEFFHFYRNQEREERRARDIETRCVVPSAHFGFKKCMEDCDNCPYGKLKRDGAPLSIDYTYTNSKGEEYEIEIEDDSPSSADLIIEEEKQELIKQLLDELKPEDRTILDLYSKGKSDSEIAVVIKSKKRTVCDRRNKLIQELQIKIKKYF